MPIDPLTASLIAGGVSIAVPYAIDGGKYLWNEYVDTGPSDDDPTHFDLGPISEAQRSLEAQEDAAMGKQMAGYQQAAGRSIGAQIAQNMGTGLTGMSPVSLLQATQGEQMANRQIADLGMQQAQVSAQRFTDKSNMAMGNIQRIKEQGGGEIKTNKQLLLYANNEDDPAVRQVYMNAML